MTRENLMSSSPHSELSDRRLTHSERNTYMECPRKMQLKYLHRIRMKRQAKALSIGSGCHYGFEAMATMNDINDVIAFAVARMDEQVPYIQDDAEAMKEHGFNREAVATILRLYAWRWASFDMEWIKAEQEFNIPMVNPETGGKSRTWTLAGKIDGIVKVDGLTYVLEHKTTSDPIYIEPSDEGSDNSTSYWQKLNVDDQVSLYYLAAQSIGYDIHGVLYDVIRKPALKPREVEVTDEHGKVVLDADGERVWNKPKKDGTRKARQTGDKDNGWVLQKRTESPDEYRERIHEQIVANPLAFFQRRPLTRSQDDLIEAQFAFWHAGQQIRDSERSGIFPRVSRSCKMFGVCEYFGLCTNGFQPGHDDVPEKFFVSGKTHAELEDADE